MAFNAAIFFLISPAALGYLFASFFFSVGAHPLGARWIQEHYVLFPGQETNDYYGPLNRFQMNIGYHNEHHDFPSVPWNRLAGRQEARAGGLRHAPVTTRPGRG